MQNVHFQVMGVDCSCGDFYAGFGLMLTADLLFSVCWPWRPAACPEESSSDSLLDRRKCGSNDADMPVLRAIVQSRLLRELVDLVGIEPTTSSMPFFRLNANVRLYKALVAPKAL
jgi:hypothetical protein